MIEISIICVNGTHGFNILWENKEKFHRLDGPAVIYLDGIKEWYKEGKFHRDDGPAITYPDGVKEWYKEGKFLKIEDPNDRD